MGDGAWSEEDVEATFASDRTPGEIATPAGVVRLVDSVSGGGLFVTNSDPDVVGVDPLTGEDAPAGTDIGFAQAVRQWLFTGVWNGDFALPPARPGDPITSENPLPYWRIGGDPNIQAIWRPSTSASGGVIRFYLTGATADAHRYLEQVVPVPTTRDSGYSATIKAEWVTNAGLLLTYRSSGLFLARDAVTAVGSETTTDETTYNTPRTFANTTGRVPSTAAYLRVRVGIVDAGAAAAYERDLAGVMVDIVSAPHAAGLYGVRARRTAAQTFADDVPESVVFTASDDFDSDAIHGAGSSILTIPTTGYWLVGGGITFEADADGRRRIYLELNGTDASGTVIPGSDVRVDAAAVGQTALVTTTMYYFSANDTVALTGWHNAGGDLDINTATLWAVRIAGG